MPSTLVKLFGTEEPPAQARVLSAGPLTVELDGGNLRYIRYQGHEAIRAVSYVVRDRFWGTFNPEIGDFEVESGADGFTVTYRGVCRDDAQEFRYAARITGSADGTLVFEGTGTAVTDFVTNRTGFVVLHPVDGVAGYPVEVAHVDGRTVETVFPELIDPKQPIMDIRALTHEVCAGLKAVCVMQGDTFEMEDQRNWTDASYKTYVRPLGLPWPYTLKAGEEITQSVTVRFEGSPSAPAVHAGAEAVRLALGAADGRVPRTGMAVEAPDAAAARNPGDELAALSPRFLSCLFDARRDPASAMGDFKALADALAVPLSLEVIVPADADPGEALRGVARAAEAAGAAPETVAVTNAGDLDFIMPGTEFPDTRPFDELFAAARSAFPGARLGGGSFAYFTELNRKRPPFAALDFVCHTTCAIVHAADDRSVTETIESLPYIVKSGRALFGDKEYRIGPGGIATRTSPFGSDPTPNPDNGRVTMTRRDPRQRGLLGAAWHLGYAARMAEGGVDSVILGSPVGDFGLIREGGGGVYPVYHVMRGIYAASSAPRLGMEITRPREVQALAHRRNGAIELWIANLMGEERRVEISGLPARRARGSVLDEATFDACCAGPGGFDAQEAEMACDAVTLTPYAVVRLRVGG